MGARLVWGRHAIRSVAQTVAQWAWVWKDSQVCVRWVLEGAD